MEMILVSFICRVNAASHSGSISMCCPTCLNTGSIPWETRHLWDGCTLTLPIYLCKEAGLLLCYLHTLEQLQKSIETFQKLDSELIGPIRWTTDQDVPEHDIEISKCSCNITQNKKRSMYCSSLQVTNQTLDTSKFKRLLGGVAVKLEASMQVSVTQMIDKRPYDCLHQILLHHEHPRLHTH